MVVRHGFFAVERSTRRDRMILRRLTTGLLDLLYPPRCLVCGAVPKVHRDHFCAACSEMLSTDSALRCPQCAGIIGPYSLREGACSDCHRHPPAFARARCLGSYHQALRTAVLRIKLASGEGLAEL